MSSCPSPTFPLSQRIIIWIGSTERGQRLRDVPRGMQKTFWGIFNSRGNALCKIYVFVILSSELTPFAFISWVL